MKKYIYLLGAFALTATLLQSCADSLDGVEQQGVLDTDKYYANATDNDAIALITSVYNSAWENYGGYPGSRNGTTVATMSDDFLATGTSIYSGATLVNAMTDDFTGLFSINYKCNMIIEKLQESSAERSRVVGEAYFWRAWAYFKLIRGWGNPPLVDHVLASNELQPGNGNTADLWNYVFTSLQEAIKRLPSKSNMNSQADLGARVTKEAAYALLGKAYLYSGDSVSAVTALEEVVNSGLYGLIDDFEDLYTPRADFSKEYMWEFNAADDNDVNRDAEQKIDFYFNWRSEVLTMPGGSHLSGFSQGYSTNFVNKDFYDFLVARSELGKPRQKGTVWTIDEAANMFITLSDDSYKGSKNYEGDNLKALTDKGMSKEHAAFQLLWNNFTNASATNCAGYLPVKVYMWNSDTYTVTSTNGIFSKANYPGMRYAEVLLLYAEAALGSSSQQKGLAALNQVRDRAGLAPLSTYNLQDVKDERRAELWGEGERFFDVVRWGDAPTAFANVGKNLYQLTADANTFTTNLVTTPFSGWTGWQDKYKLFPYPYSEMKLNPNLVQNPGW